VIVVTGNSCRAVPAAPEDRLDPQKLTRELDAAFKNRARLYKNLLDELTAALGPERAEAILVAAIEKRGEEAGRGLFGHLRAPSAAQIADAFLAVSPAEGTLFPHTRTQDGAGRTTIAVSRCPLLEAWREDGVADGEIQTLCRIAGRFDNGCFGAAGVAFVAETWTPGKTGCCTLYLGGKGAPSGR
jgi:L-2-amino-thiazoline-4-carboxylic acid hydrolase